MPIPQTRLFSAPGSRFARAAVAVAGLAAAGALILPATASAEPAPLAHPLLDSTCTFAQVDAALHDTAPELAQALDSMPDRKSRLQQFFDQPVDQRKAQLAAYLDSHPDLKQQVQNSDGPRAQELRNVLAEVADTCHNY